jgi:hypothetical protein
LTFHQGGFLEGTHYLKWVKNRIYNLKKSKAYEKVKLISRTQPKQPQKIYLHEIFGIQYLRANEIG